MQGVGEPSCKGRLVPKTKPQPEHRPTEAIQSIAVGLAGPAGLALTTCQTTAPHPALACSKGHTVHFKAPNTSPGTKPIVTLAEHERMSCPDCKNAAIAWVKTGAITKHNCSSCGGSLAHCTGRHSSGAIRPAGLLSPSVEAGRAPGAERQERDFDLERWERVQ
jgi:ribosomal protein S27E